jgi:hypothetical protein
LRSLAEDAQTNPGGVLPPQRHVLSMYPFIGPYERLGRYFVVYQAQVNMSLANNDGRHLYDNLSNLTLGISALPKELHDCMLSEFADYVVNNLLVLARGKSLCSLWSALFLKEGFFSPCNTSNLVSGTPQANSHVRRCVY